MLIPELDKLRNKELSFWCRVIDKTHSFFWKSVPEEMIIVSKGMEFHETDWVYFGILHYRWNDIVNFLTKDILYGEKYEIIWHPLTRWRLSKIFREKKILEIKSNWTKIIDENFWKLYYLIKLRFDNNVYMYDQSELERMQHEKRPELEKLLIQFTNYL